ncbi:MAG: PLD nuclease N-terminal domain-containing protein [Actinomycetes bacterium]
MVKIDAFVLIISIILQLYSLFDCARTEQEQVRKLPKWAWLIVILLFGGFGGLMWIFVGRPKTQGKGRGYGQKPRIIPPDDDPDFLRKL